MARHYTNSIMRTALHTHQVSLMGFGHTGQKKALAALEKLLEKAQETENRAGLGKGALTLTLAAHLREEWGVAAQDDALRIANPSAFPATIKALSDHIEETCNIIDTHGATLMRNASPEAAERINNFASAAGVLLRALPGQIIPPARPAERGR